MGLSALSWLGRNNDVVDAAPHDEPAAKPKWDGVYRWVDVPREQWVYCPIVELLPEDRQRYWQQREAFHGDIRLESTSSRTIETEVWAAAMDRQAKSVAGAMDRLAAALDKLERKL